MLAVMGFGTLHPAVNADDLPGLHLHRGAGEEDGRRLDHGRRIVRVGGSHRQPQPEPAAAGRLRRQIDRRLAPPGRACMMYCQPARMHRLHVLEISAGDQLRAEAASAASRSTSRQWHGSVSKLRAAGLVTGETRPFAAASQ